MTETFSIGRVLADLPVALRARWQAYLIVAVVFGIAIPWAIGASDLPLDLPRNQSNPALYLLQACIEIVLEAIPAGLIAHLTLSGSGPFRPALAAAGRATIAALPALLLIGLIARIPFLLIQFPFAWLMAEADSPYADFQKLALTFGMLQLAAGVFGFILSGYLIAARQAAVWEGLSPIAAIRRGLALVKGRDWLAMGLMLPWLLLPASLLAVLPFLNDIDPAVFQTMPVLLGAAIARSTFLTVFMVYLTLAYRELRHVVDPPSEQVAGAFE